jgi:hypothetical protein
VYESIEDNCGEEPVSHCTAKVVFACEDGSEENVMEDECEMLAFRLGLPHEDVEECELVYEEGDCKDYLVEKYNFGGWLDTCFYRAERDCRGELHRCESLATIQNGREHYGFCDDVEERLLEIQENKMERKAERKAENVAAAIAETDAELHTVV